MDIRRKQRGRPRYRNGGQLQHGSGVRYLRRINNNRRPKPPGGHQSRQMLRSPAPPGGRPPAGCPGPSSPDFSSMGPYSSNRKIANQGRNTSTSRGTVNGVLPACGNIRYGALNSVDDDGDLPACPRNLCGYLPAFSGQLYHPFSPPARNAGWNQRDR